MKVIPDPAGPEQESVWSYPRPAVADPGQRSLKIAHRDVVIAKTQKAFLLDFGTTHRYKELNSGGAKYLILLWMPVRTDNPFLGTIPPFKPLV